MKVRLLETLDHMLHKVLDPYINAKVFGRHLPAWGLLQLWQHYACDAYENAFEDEVAAAQAPTTTITWSTTASSAYWITPSPNSTTTYIPPEAGE